MSRAFVKESDRDERIGVPPPPLPPGVPNYITPAGAARLRAERERLLVERTRLRAAGTPEAAASLGAVEERIALIESREATWVELGAPTAAAEVVFGARVTLEGSDGARRTVTLVGVDEVDVPAGRVSFLSPLGRALVGARVGDVVTVERPRGGEEYEVVAIG